MIETILHKHPQWNDVFAICKTLQQKGFQTVLAGGCVRDALLGRLAKDLDVATEATPEQVEALFDKVVMVGQNFGVCRVVIAEGKEPIEVATFREEFDYKDGRHPEKVLYSSIEKDSARRDFTVNAMFFDPFKNQLIDFVEGQKDLHNQILRTVGNPQERFAEDSLRLLRAARFAAQLNFSVEQKTLTAIQQKAVDLIKVSRERWQDEINKAFSIDQPFLFFKQLQEMKLNSVLFANWSWNEEGLETFFAKSVNKKWGWAALVYLQSSFSKKQALNELSIFKISNETIRFVKLSLELEEFLFSKTPTLPAWVRLMKEPEMKDVVAFWKKMGAALKAGDCTNVWETFLTKYAPSGVLPAPVISGSDLLKAGVPPGPELGKKLEQATLFAIENPNKTKDEVLKAVISQQER